MHGVPSVIRQGQPRSTDHARGLAGLQTETCCEQERPLHSSFLLNALHRISLICAFLWFESQKEEGGGNKKRCHLFKTERKGESGCQTRRRTLPGPAVGHLTEGAKPSTPGTITGLWQPRFCAGRCRQALRWNFVMSRPGDGGPPHWSLLLVMTSPPFSPGTQCVGQFGGHRRKNSKSLTYFISKVEKDQTVTKINNFSIVFWWPWARWPWQGHWKGEGPG